MSMLGDSAWADKYAKREIGSVRSLLLAIADHRSVRLYAAIAVVAFGATLSHDQALRYLAEAAAITLVSYPFVEYALHRFVLHACVFCRNRTTARIWRRVHFDHHMDPGDLGVLFAHPGLSVVFLMFLSALAALGFGDKGLLFPMVWASFTSFIYYEAMHVAAHTGLRTAGGWLGRNCRNHVRHHYLDDRTYFGIGADILDRLLKRFAETKDTGARSPTVRNLGYDSEMAARYPWVAEGYARKKALAKSRAPSIG